MATIQPNRPPPALPPPRPAPNSGPRAVLSVVLTVSMLPTKCPEAQGGVSIQPEGLNDSPTHRSPTPLCSPLYGRQVGAQLGLLSLLLDPE